MLIIGIKERAPPHKTLGIQDKNGSEPLPSGLHAMTHGLVKANGAGLGIRQALIQALIDQVLPLLEFLSEIHDLRIC